MNFGVGGACQGVTGQFCWHFDGPSKQQHMAKNLSWWPILKHFFMFYSMIELSGEVNVYAKNYFWLPLFQTYATMVVNGDLFSVFSPEVELVMWSKHTVWLFLLQILGC